MPCNHPIDAWKSPKGVFHKPTPDSQFFQHPCGSCMGCRIKRTQDWAMRMMHELRFHDCASFITLTFDNDHYPVGGSLSVFDFQQFMRNLRYDIKPRKVRYFHSGEYGEKLGRPHHHAIMFGLDFRTDRYDVEVSKSGFETWKSPQLDRLWPYGINYVGSVSFESCQYVAKYVTKKVNGKDSYAHYQRICEANGEVFQVKPEFATMSRRPGIGRLHFDKYCDEIYLRDEVAVNGFLRKPPKSYDKLLEKFRPEVYEEIKAKRECALALSPRKVDLVAREKILLDQIGLLSPRRYENGK